MALILLDLLCVLVLTNLLIILYEYQKGKYSMNNTTDVHICINVINAYYNTYVNQ